MALWRTRGKDGQRQNYADLPRNGRNHAPFIGRVHRRRVIIAALWHTEPNQPEPKTAVTIFRAVPRLAPLLAVLGLFWTATAQAAETAQSAWHETEQTRARLIAAVTGTGSAEVLRLGLEFHMIPGWKIYWRSPGDAGIPPRPRLGRVGQSERHENPLARAGTVQRGRPGDPRLQEGSRPAHRCRGHGTGKTARPQGRPFPT